VLLDREWDFNGNSPTALDGIHPYPAKFIREIPLKLLRELAPDKNLFVYDPFCGSGTTLTVAQSLGYKTLGVDLNPIACLISRVKTNLFSSNNKFNIKKLVQQAQIGVNYDEHIDIKNLKHWFLPHVACELSSIKRSIENIKDTNLFDVLSLALSSIVVRVSNQDSDTRYAAISKNITPKAVYGLFENAFIKISNALLSRDYTLTESLIFEHNALTFDNPLFHQKVGIVVTSPPYPNAYEYWLYHKYRLYWLGYDPLKVKESEIGARAHFFKKNYHDEHTFYEQMLSMFEGLSKYLIPGGYACFVVGRSKIHGKLVDNAKIIAKAGANHSFQLVDMVQRELQSTRKSFNLSHANIKKENLVILRYEY
jgi:site-specific DNA-methyltransferase (cytosine-N4-specific)